MSSIAMSPASSARATAQFSWPMGSRCTNLEDIGIDLPRGDYTTVAGVMLEALGHVPVARKGGEVGDYMLTAEEDRNAIVRFKIAPTR